MINGSTARGVWCRQCSHTTQNNGEAAAKLLEGRAWRLAFHAATVARFAAHGKPRGVVASAAGDG
jgi:hypothetical protein